MSDYVPSVYVPGVRYYGDHDRGMSYSTRRRWKPKRREPKSAGARRNENIGNFGKRCAKTAFTQVYDHDVDSLHLVMYRTGKLRPFARESRGVILMKCVRLTRRQINTGIRHGVIESFGVIDGVTHYTLNVGGYIPKARPGYPEISLDGPHLVIQA